MKKVKRFFTSMLSLALACVMLFQVVACSTSKSDNSSSGTTNPPTDSSPDDEYIEYPVDEIISVVVNLAQKQPLVGETTQRKRVISAEKLDGFNAALTATSQDGLTSYSSDGVDVVYDTNADEYGVYDTVTVDDTILLEQEYYGETDDEMALGEIYADYYEVEIDYSTDGKVVGLYYYDRYYIYEYDTNGNLTDIYRDGAQYKTFTYNANGDIATEESVDKDGSFVKTYAYAEDGSLYSVNDAAVNGAESIVNGVSVGDKSFVWEGQAVSLNYGEKLARFEYEYAFNEERFLTAKSIGGSTTTYKYVGDKVVEIDVDGETVSYILDKDLNYVGLSYRDVKYYFSVDPFGNVMGLADVDGNFVVEYQYDIWGSICGISGELADSLGTLNEIVNLNGLYDHTLNCYFFADSIYLPSDGITLRERNVSYAKNMYAWEQSNYFARSAVSSFARIHDMVVDVAVKNLQEQGLDVVSNLYAMDESGASKRLVDIYTLDYSLTPFSAMNLLHGNQIYEVIYHAPDSEKFESIANAKLQEITDSWTVSYFADYAPSAGKMTFNGQFIFLGYLIDYKCAENGIIEYQVKNNVKQNYDQTVNIYDYDRNQYACYVNNTFDLNFLDGVTIIPGINQEQYEAIEGYLSDYLQSVAGNICDQMLIYDDPNYYDLENMNVLPDYWSQINIGDTTTYLEIQGDGSISAEKMPAWDTDGFATKVAIGAGVVIVTAVVATIAIMIPGVNCVVVSICVGAAKGAAIGAATGFAMGFVQPLIGITLEGVATGKWDFTDYFDKALSAAADGVMTGAITGAIVGGISGGLNPRYCFGAGTTVATDNGSVAIENLSVGDMVWSYDYQTGEKSLKPVTATTARETDRIITMGVGGEQIVTTPEHPFYVVNHDEYDGYIAAKYLSVGDCIQTSDGGYMVIESMEEQVVDEPITVYNITVEDNHSYYVGEDELLVHNLSCNDSDVGTYKNLRKASKGTGNEVHHIVEKRFAPTLGIENTDDMLSITLSKADHWQFTKAWRSYLPTGHTYTKDQILAAATEIYKNHPALLNAALKTIG